MVGEGGQKLGVRGRVGNQQCRAPAARQVGLLPGATLLRGKGLLFKWLHEMHPSGHNEFG